MYIYKRVYIHPIEDKQQMMTTTSREEEKEEEKREIRQRPPSLMVLVSELRSCRSRGQGQFSIWGSSIVIPLFCFCSFKFVKITEHTPPAPHSTHPRVSEGSSAWIRQVAHRVRTAAPVRIECAILPLSAVSLLSSFCPMVLCLGIALT